MNNEPVWHLTTVALLDNNNTLYPIYARVHVPVVQCGKQHCTVCTCRNNVVHRGTQ